ncbi:hypothetical protein PR048_031407 [Dryococelus australis]|uniref:Uncharacterized protein n=1 Tax=Dryococelus australis TaxID=614101 RepID=A0ABQ9G566_9NEOP|nr:hypothetical protein PR048_031407 [Dryococelus australis]
MEDFVDALEFIEKELQANYNFKKTAFHVKNPDEQKQRRENIMGRIENVIFGVVESAARLSAPSLQIRNQRDWDNIVFTDRWIPKNKQYI